MSAIWTVWTCSVCGYTSNDPDLNFPTICPSCKLIYSSPDRVFDPSRRNNDPDRKIVGAKLMQREFVERKNKWANSPVEAGRAAWDRLHSYTGCDPSFLVEWEKTIPSSSCSCKESYNVYKAEDRPDFSSPMAFFRWGCRIHNRVNAKLGKPVFAFWEAVKQWKPQQSQISDLVVVTSMSCLPKHLEVQGESLRTWKSLGLTVISGNTPEEIPILRELYDIEFFEVRPSLSYDRPNPRVYDLLQLGGDRARLMINSDIAIYGDQRMLIDAVKNQENLLGLRQNWVGSISNLKVERWGIDAFVIHSEQAATFPDLDFAIGQTMWDYWVPYHLQKIGGKLRWYGDPFFFHEAHPIHWKEESTSIGQGMIASHYGETIDWEGWRRSLPFGEPRR